MYYEKRYLQFNDLVFDGYDMISDYSEPIRYKGSSTAISYGHGNYRPMKADYLFVSERQVSMTITLKLKKIPCEYRRFYALFAEQELSKPGKLWAIKNGEILWANAMAANRRPINNSRQDEIVWDIEFIIPSGVWNKADKQKTFVLPYDVCSLMDCKGFEEYNPCATSKGGGDCCAACEDNRIAANLRDRCGCCCDGDVTADMALCYHTNEFQSFYSCDTLYQLVYNCEAAEKFNTEKAFGQRLCVEDICKGSIISGQIYSNTDIPTTDVTITLAGEFKNPQIKINDNTNIIEGEYHGRLMIESSGDVYYQPSECCDAELLDPSLWTVPKGNDYGWTIYPQLNSVVVYMNKCASAYGANCVYIEHTPITT